MVKLLEYLEYSFLFKYFIVCMIASIVAGVMALVQPKAFEFLGNWGVPLGGLWGYAMLPITLFLCAGAFLLLAYIAEWFSRL